MGTGAIFIKLMKVKDVQFFNESVVVRLFLFVFCAPAPFELGNFFLLSFFKLLQLLD